MSKLSENGTRVKVGIDLFGDGMDTVMVDTSVYCSGQQLRFLFFFKGKKSLTEKLGIRGSY